MPRFAVEICEVSKSTGISGDGAIRSQGKWLAGASHHSLKSSPLSRSQNANSPTGGNQSGCCLFYRERRWTGIRLAPLYVRRCGRF